LLAAAAGWARSASVTPQQAEAAGLTVNRDGVRRTAFDLLAYPTVDMAAIARIWPEVQALPRPIAEQIEIDAKYAVYVERQKADILAFRRDEAVAIPAGVDLASLPGLSNEARQKLLAARPETIGQASRIDGITPATLTLLLAAVRKGRTARAS
jgi:tRNA uridine 5-carboxymethylaminomethyl modification enzyme